MELMRCRLAGSVNKEQIKAQDSESDIKIQPKQDVQGDWLKEWKKRQELKKQKRLEKEKEIRATFPAFQKQQEKPQEPEQPKEITPTPQTAFESKPVVEQRSVEPAQSVQPTPEVKPAETFEKQTPERPSTFDRFNQRSAEREQPEPAALPSIEKRSAEKESLFASWKKRQEAKASPSPAAASKQVSEPVKPVSTPSQQLTRPPNVTSHSPAPVTESPKPVTQTPQRSENLEKVTPSQASHTSYENVKKSQEREVPTTKDYIQSLAAKPAPVAEPSPYKSRYETFSREKFQKLSENAGVGEQPTPQKKEPSPIVVDKSPEEVEKPQPQPESNSLYNMFAARKRNFSGNRDGYSAEKKQSMERGPGYGGKGPAFAPTQDVAMKPAERTTIEIDQEEIVLPDEGSVQIAEKPKEEPVQEKKTEPKESFQEYLRRKRQAEQEQLAKVEDSDSEVRANKGKSILFHS